MKGQLDLPAGFRFHPTDDELVNHYLVKKCGGQSIPVPIIAEIDLYRYDPWQLPDMALYGEKDWYFFTPRDRKYPNGSRPNRAAGGGYWKATGADKPIGKPRALGIKKALVFYAGKAPKGVKTNWIMHEYRLANVDRSAGKKNNIRLDDWVLCRIYNKKGSIEKHYPIVRKTIKYPEEEEEEDTKFNIYIPTHHQNNDWLQPPPPPRNTDKLHQQQQRNADNQLHTDTSDSILRMHTYSSGSEHVLSPDIKEVQSEPKLNEFDFGFDQVNTSQEDPFGNVVQYQVDQLSPLQDMFMFLQKPF